MFDCTAALSSVRDGATGHRWAAVMETALVSTSGSCPNVVDSLYSVRLVDGALVAAVVGAVLVLALVWVIVFLPFAFWFCFFYICNT